MSANAIQIAILTAISATVIPVAAWLSLRSERRLVGGHAAYAELVREYMELGIARHRLLIRFADGLQHRIERLEALEGDRS
jgi:hypothetical protein